VYISYPPVKCPGPITNRDFVNQRSWRWFGDEYIIFNHSIPHQVSGLGRVGWRVVGVGEGRVVCVREGGRESTVSGEREG